MVLLVLGLYQLSQEVLAIRVLQNGVVAHKYRHEVIVVLHPANRKPEAQDSLLPFLCLWHKCQGQQYSLSIGQCRNRRNRSGVIVTGFSPGG